MSKHLIRFIDTSKDGAIFFATLRKRVDEHFKVHGKKRNANSSMILKTFIMLSAYLLPFIFFNLMDLSPLTIVFLGLIMGLGLAGIGMCVMHDAVHGAYSKKHQVNRWLGYTINLLGASVFNWKIQHNTLHHTYTNVISHDEDIQNKFLLRFSPHSPIKWYHKLQVFYALGLYGLMTLYWTLAKDFIQYRRYLTNGYTNKQTKRLEIIKLITSKIIYFIIILFVPVLIFERSWSHTLILFLSMHFVAGIVLTVVFQLAHTVNETDYPLADSDGIIHNNWAVHQLQTTVDFARHNKILTWYLGGLNFQIEHHLFPTICHVHYPDIAPIVESTAKEFGIPYHYHNTFKAAIGSHFQALIKFGHIPHPDEAIV